MSLALHYLQTAAALVSGYKGEIPFAPFVKQFFAAHKKYGSRDRKAISTLCHSFFRLGKALPAMPVEEKIVLALFLCSSSPGHLLEQLNAEWNSKTDLSLQDKLAITGNPTLLKEIAPFAHLLSTGIDGEDYSPHFLTKPDVFIRVRPGQKDAVVNRLQELQWNFAEEGGDAIRLEAGLPIDKHFQLNTELVVQDLNSQRTGNIIRDVFEQNNFIPSTMWDCCAASGGKSIMMHDIYPRMSFTVSDIRPSILHNLKQRFAEAGIKKFNSFVADLSQPGKGSTNQLLNSSTSQPINLLLTDVPCTGSGTWARTPEQLYFFDEHQLSQFNGRQIAIVSNSLPYLKKDGYLIYITCSVFKTENEVVIENLMACHPLSLIKSCLLDGTHSHSDTMYIAILKKEM